MKIITGNLWDKYQVGRWICIPTNGSLKGKDNNFAVMGKGLALEAANRFPTLPRLLASRIKRTNNQVYLFAQLGLFTFPTKTDWHRPSTVPLLMKSCGELIALVDKYGMEEVYLPQVGCGEGGLRWHEVGPDLQRMLDDRFVVVIKEKEREDD